MAVFYNAGEVKTRPGVYQRYSNRGGSPLTGARDGVCAIPIRSHWGPLNKVQRITSLSELEKIFGSGDYGTGHTVPAAAELFRGGANTVYAYRIGTGGTAASKAVTDGPTFTAKYPGAATLAVSVATKIGDSSTKVCNVYFGTELVETFEFAADGTAEGANLVAATANSKYITVTAASTVTTVAAIAAASGALTGGADPTVTNASYSAAFAALEGFPYNTICLDVDDDSSMTLSLLLQAYLDNAYLKGKLAIAVVGEMTTVALATRQTHSRAFNDAKVVYLGGGWKASDVSKDGALAIAYTAGLIAATPSNQGITHTAVTGATDLCEELTYADYEDCINAGMLMVSLSPDGQVWYDSSVNTLITPAGNEDDGWKKIRRVKVRFELFDRMDRLLARKVGKVSADSDGIADILQTGARLLASMAAEGKIRPGGIFAEDPDNPYTGDSAWFIIQADDIDSLEKIYLHYMFRYSQNT